VSFSSNYTSFLQLSRRASDDEPRAIEHGSLPREDLNIPYQAHTWPQWEAASIYQPAIQVPRIPRAPNQSQYEFLNQFSRSNNNISDPIFAVFELPDELILSILSHISPEPQLTGHRARFRVQYFMEMSDDYYQRARFLLPLSMTCKTMRLRLRPWIWDVIEPSRRRHVMNLAIVDALHADTSLAASVRYICAILCPRV